MADLGLALDVFISHSHHDADIAEALADLLRRALSIPAEKIRCTSVDDYRLPVGVSVDNRLRLEVVKSRVFIAVITNASLESAYVLFELGARWGAQLFLAPILVSKERSLLKGPLAGLNAVSCDSRPQIERFLGEVARELQLNLIQRDNYEIYLNRLIELSIVPRTHSTVGILRREIGNLYDTLARVLTVAQNAHLQTLTLKEPPSYKMHKSLREELKSLEHLGFIEAQSGCSMGDINDEAEFMLKDYFRLRSIGRSYLRWLAESAP